MNRLFYIIFITTFFLSCRKEKAQSPAPFLIGEWEYYYSYVTTTGGGVITPDSDAYHSINIDKKGHVCVFDKNGLVEKGHIKQIELVQEYQTPEVSYFYNVSFQRTSYFKEKFIITGIDRIWYWPSYNFGPGGTKEQIRIFTNEFKGEEYQNGGPDSYYKRK